MLLVCASDKAFSLKETRQHAYERTLLWEVRTDADAERALLRHLGGDELNEGERLCLGDWCMARGVEHASTYNLPFKIHTGYYASTGWMPVERIRPGHLCGLLMRYPNTRFVLMDNAYPYSDELIAIAKHYPNAYIDMCWAWSIDPY